MPARLQSESMYSQSALVGAVDDRDSESAEAAERPSRGRAEVKSLVSRCDSDGSEAKRFVPGAARSLCRVLKKRRGLQAAPPWRCLQAPPRRRLGDSQGARSGVKSLVSGRRLGFGKRGKDRASALSRRDGRGSGSTRVEARLGWETRISDDSANNHRHGSETVNSRQRKG